jgi:hypothetical protein
MTAWRAARMPLWSVALLLAACAPYQTTEKVTPVSYRMAEDALGRNVGLLRRMALMELSQAPPNACGANYDGRLAWSAVEPDMHRVLGNEKGYELIDVGASGQPAALIDEIGSWPAPDKLVKAGPSLGALLDSLRNQRQVDALLVRLDRRTCQMAEPALRLAMGAMTLGLNELLPNPEMTKIYLVTQAWVFETATGKLVWQHSVFQSQQELKAFFESRPVRQLPNPTDSLLAPLEPAIPRILTR